MMDIMLNFINLSADMNNSQVVIFQKNVAAGYRELSVAWRVIQNCGHGDNHPFLFPLGMAVSASDSWGNHTPQLDASPGDAFGVTLSGSGDTLAKSGRATYPTEIQVTNSLTMGSINVNIYKDGRKLATKTSVAPNQMAAFEFKPTIWIGSASQIIVGTVLSSAIVDSVNTELSLLGIRSADIIMRGGGAGQASLPVTFSLENISWS